MANGNGNSLDFSNFLNVIDGKLSGTKEITNSINPATDEELLACPISTLQDVNDAVGAARAAFKSWGKTSLEHRKQQLRAFASALTEHKSEFAKLLTSEQGKPVRIHGH